MKSSLAFLASGPSSTDWLALAGLVFSLQGTSTGGHIDALLPFPWGVESPLGGQEPSCTRTQVSPLSGGPLPWPSPTEKRMGGASRVLCRARSPPPQAEASAPLQGTFLGTPTPHPQPQSPIPDSLHKVMFTQVSEHIAVVAKDISRKELDAIFVAYLVNLHQDFLGAACQADLERKRQTGPG